MPETIMSERDEKCIAAEIAKGKFSREECIARINSACCYCCIECGINTRECGCFM